MLPSNSNMEVLTSKNRMSATMFLSLYFSKNVITKYYSISNGPAVTQHSEDPFITYCLTSSFILLCVFLLVTYFKDSILRTLLRIGDGIHCISLHVAYIFNVLFALYTVWKELKQLQSQDQHFQQPRTRKVFIQIPLPPDEFFTEVREQLTIILSTEQISSIEDIQQEYRDSQVFQTEQLLLLHTPNIFIEWTYPHWSFAMTELH